jgi:hypothetical protein
MDPSLNREEELLRGGPKRVDCCGSLVRVERPRDGFNRSVLSRAFSPGASHLIERHTSKRSVCADIR